MAKSSRSSAVKKNNQRLKKHVFGPIEAARNERLSAKLLELASQPKPPRTEMEVEQDGTFTPAPDPPHLINKSTALTDTSTPLAEARNAAADSGAKGEGASASLSIPIPACFLHFNNDNGQNLPTPPDTPPADNDTTTTTSAFPILDTPAQRKMLAKKLLFFHLLGASTDILGFDANGDLELSFAEPG